MLRGMPKQEQSENETLLRAQDQFILEWGRMSSSWGINRTMAQIHALLFVAGKPLTVDEIMQRLLISRGNASMSLRDLMDWGIVRRFRRPGERRDTYQSETDAWQMFARVVRERKRREIDPTARAIRECIAMLPDASESDEQLTFRNRLQGLLEVFDLLDAVYQQVFSTDNAFFETVSGLKGQTSFLTSENPKSTAKKT
jgi:HTH-type transcriptional regulator, glycine betaine synthesis regulator